MGRRFVDARWIRQRMDRKDDRLNADLRRRFPRVVPFLAPEVFPTDTQVIRDEPVTTKLHLTAREMTACSELLAQGRTLLEALRGIQQMRAFLASFPNTGGAR
jgi:hypothetical protein